MHPSKCQKMKVIVESESRRLAWGVHWHLPLLQFLGRSNWKVYTPHPRRIIQDQDLHDSSTAVPIWLSRIIMHNSPNKQPANSPGNFWRCLLQVPSLISPNSAPPGVCEPEPVEVAIQFGRWLMYLMYGVYRRWYDVQCTTCRNRHPLELSNYLPTYKRGQRQVWLMQVHYNPQ